MPITDQSWTRHANTSFTLRWDGIVDEDAEETDPPTLKNLSGKVVKFALARFAGSEPQRRKPLLAFSSDDASPRVTVPNPEDGDPHVLVEVLSTDTADLAPKTTDYYAELEVRESDGSIPVVVATGTLTLLPNVDNE